MGDLRRRSWPPSSPCSSATGNLLPILGGLLVSGPLYLGLGFVLAKFGYQRKTLADLRTPRAAPSSSAAAGAEARRRAAPPGTDAPHVERSEPAVEGQAPVTCVIAIDAGTTGIRSRAVFTDGSPSVGSYREFTQHFPQPGWVEHDPAEIWDAARATLHDVVEQVGAASVAAIGITNQRETVVAWDRATGQPYGRAIVWQDRRTAARCDELAAAGALDLVRAAHRSRARPVLQRHEVRVAARSRRRSRHRATWRSARSTPG